MKRIDKRLPGLVVLVALAAALVAGFVPGSAKEPTRARVVRVVDGDTIVVESSDGTERVRYIGIDTPESVKPNTPIQCYAKTASHLNEALVAGHTVTLTYGPEKRDRYGRLLAYVTTEDGVDVNATLVERGAAKTLEIKPNTQRASKYGELEAKARNMQAGLWAVCADAHN